MKKIYDDSNLLFQIFEENQRKMLLIFASAIQNNYLEPDPALIKFLGNNIDGETIVILLQVSLKQANIQFFFDSIILMNGPVEIISPNQTKSSPLDGSELIAAHTPESQAPANTLLDQMGCKWKLAGNNFMLNRASINTNDDDEEGFSEDGSNDVQLKEMHASEFLN